MQEQKVNKENANYVDDIRQTLTNGCFFCLFKNLVGSLRQSLRTLEAQQFKAAQQKDHPKG
jgi:hypothetical protein